MNLIIFEILRLFCLNRLPKLYLTKPLGNFGCQWFSTSYIFYYLNFFRIELHWWVLCRQNARLAQIQTFQSWYLWWVYLIQYTDIYLKSHDFILGNFLNVCRSLSSIIWSHNDAISIDSEKRKFLNYLVVAHLNLMRHSIK